jgi:S1-C subfamily serine protease
VLVCAGLAQGLVAHAAERSVSFERGVFRMEEGVVWGHISGGANCDVDLERLQWGREDSEIHTQRLGAVFRQAMASVGGRQEDENLFDDKVESADLQVAAAISDLRGNLCEQRGQFGYRGSVSMTVQWQVYDPAAHQLVGRFETHATGQSSQNTRGGVEDLLFGAFRENARDLMSDSGFQRLLKAQTAVPGTSAGKVASQTSIGFTPTAGGAGRSPAKAVQSVVLVVVNDGHGSGFLISKEGYVLTNQHVVGRQRTVRIRWQDGSEGPGEVVRSDARRDVALVKVQSSIASPLALHLALPAQGEAVFAVGAPLDPGLQGTLTRGIVSANRVMHDQPFIQSDVAVTHGNSGGPMLNERGEVVGITDLTISENGAPVGLNLFIPIGDALRALSLTPLVSPATAQIPLARRRTSRR